MENNEPIILFNKDGFTFTRKSEHNYKINLSMTNNNILLDKLIDFGIMKLIYDLNPDIYIQSSIEKLNENEAIVTLLLKHLFEDIGLPQKYSCVHMIKKVEENKVTFISKSILSHRPEGIPETAELLSIDNLECVCHIESSHKINFTFEANFNKKRRTPPHFVQKMLGVILNKIFKRVKQFIENLQ
jgi:hypothetical protein